MNRLISRFFTIYWSLYFPTCIAFNDMPGFSSVDELMTVILIFFTFVVYLSNSVKWRKPVEKIMKEYFIFLCILAAYTIYSLFIGVNVSGGVWLDFIQELRPYSIVFCVWILNPQFSRRQKNLMLATMLATLVLWIGTHPTGVVYDDEGNVSHAEFPVLCQMALCTGMSWYIFTKPTNRNKWIAVALALSGMLAPKFKYFGEIICFVAYLFFVKKRLNFRSPKTIGFFAILVFVVLFATWTRFDQYYVTGMVEDERARPLTYQTAFGKILWDYFPFGPGMGTFACNGAWRYYSPLYYKYELNQVWGLTPGGGFICDAYYPSLCQYGIFGLFLFCWFWKRRISNAIIINDVRYYRIAFVVILCLFIESTSDSSYVSGKGMGYFMILGLCLNANRNLKAHQEKLRKIQIVRERQNILQEKDMVNK